MSLANSLAPRSPARESGDRRCFRFSSVPLLTKRATACSRRFQLVNLAGLSLAVLALASGLCAAERALTDTSHSPHAIMAMPDLDAVKWTGGFWGERFAVCRDTMVPHLWEIFQDDNESHAWSNFLIAAGQGKGRDGKFHGPPFNDGDFLKWFEALVQVYAVTHDPKLEPLMDRIVDVVAKAQREDGYLHTQVIIPQRAGDPTAREFENREHFETYNMGHLMTAACVHYRVTGQTTLLAAARKAADYLERLCASDPAGLARNAICPSHYMGVVELYRVTREPRYLALAKRLVEIRSLVSAADGSDQNQDRVPFRQMVEAVGHAVRANYLYAGVADVFAESGDAALLKTLTALARDVSGQKLYITGATGALYDGASPDGSSKNSIIKTVHQAYGRDYQLPNLTAYNESCATVGYALWMWRMLTITGDARYADLFEQSLYNGVLAAISLEGRDYFYVNPLKKLDDFKVPLRWSRTRQPNIKSSFCCPPNVVRTIAEAHNYAYALSPDTLWVHLYGASTLGTTLPGGARLRLKQESDYPWNGTVKLTFVEAPARAMALRLRIPGWLHAGDATIKVNGSPAEGSSLLAGDSSTLGSPSPPSRLLPAGTPQPGSYFELKREWKTNDVVELALNFAPTRWEANPLVEETLGQVAVKCGPLVYCVESKDLPAGVRLVDVALAAGGASFAARREQIGSAEVATLTTGARALDTPRWAPGELYREAVRTTPREFELKLVPYFAWGNRGEADMSVWLPVR